MPNTPYLLKSVHEEFALRMGGEHEQQNKRIKKLESAVEDIGSLTASVEKLASSVEQMVKAQEKQGERLEALEQKPAKRWDAFVDKVIWAVAAALITYALTQMGL